MSRPTRPCRSTSTIPNLWANPAFSYGLTVEPQFVLDSGANDAGADTLNDVFNNSPYNTQIPDAVSHSQHTTETRWTGQQNFHTGSGSRVNISAPGDDVLLLGQVEDADGIPVSPAASTPRLIGGSSASAPAIAGAAAVVRQAARLLGQNLTAVQVRDLLPRPGATNMTPAFDLSKANIGPTLDLTAAVQSLFEPRARQRHPVVRADDGGPAQGRADADRPAVGLLDRHVQNPIAGHRDDRPHPVWSRRRAAPTRRSAASGDNLFAPITFGVDAVFIPQPEHEVDAPARAARP